MNRLHAALYVLRGRSVVYGGKERIRIVTNYCSIDINNGLVDGLDVAVGSEAAIREMVDDARAKETARLAEAIAHGKRTLKRQSTTYIGEIDPPSVHFDGDIMLDPEEPA